MNKINYLMTTMLVFTFSANTAFAENTMLNVEQNAENYTTGMKQVESSTIGTKSAVLDEVIDTKDRIEIERKKLQMASYPKNKENEMPESPKSPIIGPTKTIKDKIGDLKTSGNGETSKKPSPEKTDKTSVSGKLTVAKVRKMFFPGKAASQLSSQQRREVLNNYRWLLKDKATLAFLIAITKVEGTSSPRTVVGGLKNKSPECKRLINKLDLSKHAVEQNLPKRCFLSTSQGLSTAYGYFQFVYYRTFRHLKKQFGFKNFSRQTQAMAALELARRSKGGVGFIALAANKDPETAVRKSTQDWAGSEFSTLPGRKQPILKIVRTEMKKLKDQKYYQKWLDEFTNDKNS